MIDIHSHILPLVDDGSQDMETSLEMIRMSAESGVKIIVATPHSNQRGRFENYFGLELKRRFLTLREEVKKAEIPIQLILGMEIYASPDVRSLIEDGLLIGLNQTDYFLVEFPFGVHPEDIIDVQNQIFDCGGIPLIAHPERYICVQNNPAMVYDWLQEGVCTQCNKSSVFGGFGETVRRTAEFLYRYDLVTCIGSDAHSTDFRNTDLSKLKSYLTELYGKEYTSRVMLKNAFTILKNEDVPEHGVMPDMNDLPEGAGARKRRKFFH